MEPGFQLVLEGGNEKVTITVLDETIKVDDVLTRIVEEREWKNGNLVEVSRNFFAIDEATKDVFYFGEEVDDYKDGEIVNHGGAWLAGQGDAEPGMMMPGQLSVGQKYYQEIAPAVAVVIDADYGDPHATHGPEGLLVVRGKRLDGADKCDDDFNAAL